MNAADKKKLRDANNKLRTTTNKKHVCKFCKNEYYKNCIGKHLFSAHPTEMRAALASYKTRITKPSLPLKAASDMFVCLCCHEIWNTAGRASTPKHIAKCDPEAQIKALYDYLDCEAPTAEITVRVPVAGAVKEAEEENAALMKMNTQQKIAIEKLSAVKNDQTEWKVEKKRLDKKIAYLEYLLFAKSALLVAQRDAAVARIKENEQNSIVKEINSITYDEDTRAEMLKLGEDIKLYVSGRNDDECLTIKRIVPEPAPAPEPTPEPAPKQKRESKPHMFRQTITPKMLEYTPEPEPEPAPEPAPAHNPNECPVCCADYMEWDKQTTCVNCKKTCHFDDDVTGCGTMACLGCAGQTCKTCWRACGATKLKPYCSNKCKDPQDAIYLESRQGVKYVPKSPA
jgi:hypothetical protein